MRPQWARSSTRTSVSPMSHAVLLRTVLATSMLLGMIGIVLALGTWSNRRYYRPPPPPEIWYPGTILEDRPSISPSLAQGVYHDQQL